MPDFLQFGALGILGYVVWWLTRKLNGSVDALTASNHALKDAILGASQRNTVAVTRNTQAIARLAREIRAEPLTVAPRRQGTS